MTDQLEPCRFCGREIARSAEKCPQCGGETELTANIEWWTHILTFIVAVTSVIFFARLMPAFWH
jgi:RNA polymerase subunit RPABC4/transcription elongation factor Spt4